MGEGISEVPVALVTGASRGIGRAVALELASNGYAIVVNYRQSATAAADVCHSITSNGGTAIPRRANVGNSAEAHELVAQVVGEFGRIDVLVNNAGCIPSRSDWMQTDDDSWREALDVNVGAMVWLSRAVAPQMRPRGGCIVNLGSVYGEMGAAAVLGYTVAKAGVTAVTRALAKELAPSIRVNSVVPGNIDTEMTQAAGEALIGQAVAATPLGRLGDAKEVARFIRFLVTEGTFFTGASIVIDGGFSLR